MRAPSCFNESSKRPPSSSVESIIFCLSAFFDRKCSHDLTISSRFLFMLTLGSRCFVFYRYDGYFAVDHVTERKPRVGLCEGWTEAEILAMEGTRVRVRHLHRYWMNSGGDALDMSDEENSVQWVDQTAVARAPEPPMLGLIIVMWGGDEAPALSSRAAGFWGPSGSPVSPLFAKNMLDAVHTRCGTRYEAHIAFVSNQSELGSLCERRLRQRVQGAKRKAALYLLWPTQFDDDEAGRPGMVPAAALFDLMQRLEMCGVHSKFPHSSHVYRLLVSKEWTTMKKFNTPRTTRVSVSTIIDDAQQAATLALQGIRRKDKGVAKLGYSWEAEDVIAWSSLPELADALMRLATQPGCRAEFVYVQEYVHAKGEIRAYCLQGRVVHFIYTAFSLSSQHRFDNFRELRRDAVLTEWFAGDELQLTSVENKVRRLAKKWLKWFRDFAAEPLLFLRVDCFVTLENDVLTGELTELGASFLSWHAGPGLVRSALVESCL